MIVVMCDPIAVAWTSCMHGYVYVRDGDACNTSHYMRAVCTHVQPRMGRDVRGRQGASPQAWKRWQDPSRCCSRLGL